MFKTNGRWPFEQCTFGFWASLIQVDFLPNRKSTNVFKHAFLPIIKLTVWVQSKPVSKSEKQGWKLEKTLGSQTI